MQDILNYIVHSIAQNLLNCIVVMILIIFVCISSYLRALSITNTQIDPEKQKKWLGLNNDQQIKVGIGLAIVTLIFYFIIKYII